MMSPTQDQTAFSPSTSRTSAEACRAASSSIEKTSGLVLRGQGWHRASVQLLSASWSGYHVAGRDGGQVEHDEQDVGPAALLGDILWLSCRRHPVCRAHKLVACVGAPVRGW